jgi:hypothetical protein
VVGRAFQRSLGHSSGRFGAGVLLFHRFAAGLLGITFSSPPISFLRRVTPPLHHLARRELDCFQLIKALNFQQVVSKPGASYDAGRETTGKPRQDMDNVLTPN